MNDGVFKKVSIKSVLGESCDSSDFSDLNPKWWPLFETQFHICCDNNFKTGLDLLKVIESHFKTKFFSKNSNHLAQSIHSDTPCSELLGTLLMGLIWSKTQQHPISILQCDKLYYFESPNGEITRVNSNTGRTLNATEKYELFENENTHTYNMIEFIEHYYEELCGSFIKEEKYLSLIKAQTYMITYYPKQAKWFARRGLTYKRIGRYSDAITDLKRYFSFHSFQDAHASTRNAIIELEGLKAIDHFSNVEIH